MCHEIDAESNIDIRGLDIGSFGCDRPTISHGADARADHRGRQIQTCRNQASLNETRRDHAGAPRVADPRGYRQCDGAG